MWEYRRALSGDFKNKAKKCWFLNSWQICVCLVPVPEHLQEGSQECDDILTHPIIFLNLNCINILMSVFVNCHLQNIVTMLGQFIQIITIYTHSLQAWLDNCCYTDYVNCWSIIPSLLLKCSNVVYITKYCLHWWPDIPLHSLFHTVWKQKKWATPHLLESNIFTGCILLSLWK